MKAGLVAIAKSKAIGVSANADKKELEIRFGACDSGDEDDSGLMLQLTFDEADELLQRIVESLATARVGGDE